MRANSYLMRSFDRSKHAFVRCESSFLLGVCIYIGLLAITLAASSCGGRADVEPSRDNVTVNRRSSGNAGNSAMWTDLTIESNTQAHIGNVAIGAGNCWTAEFTGADGNKLTGLSCALWISVKDDPAGGHSLRVGPGSTFAAGNYDFEVVEVFDDAIRLQYKINFANY